MDFSFCSDSGQSLSYHNQNNISYLKQIEQNFQNALNLDLNLYSNLSHQNFSGCNEVENPSPRKLNMTPQEICTKDQSVNVFFTNLAEKNYIQDSEDELETRPFCKQNQQEEIEQLRLGQFQKLQLQDNYSINSRYNKETDMKSARLINIDYDKLLEEIQSSQQEQQSFIDNAVNQIRAKRYINDKPRER
eukprot:403354953